MKWFRPEKPKKKTPTLKAPSADQDPPQENNEIYAKITGDAVTGYSVTIYRKGAYAGTGNPKWNLDEARKEADRMLAQVRHKYATKVNEVYRG